MDEVRARRGGNGIGRRRLDRLRQPGAEGLAKLPGIKLDPATVETNLVFFDLTGSIDAPAAVQGLLARGVRMGALGPRTIRAVTHLDVSAAAIDKTLAAAREIFRG